MVEIENDIKEFFRLPEDFDVMSLHYSTLFLLRRDILTCFGYNPNDKEKMRNEALIPGTMAIMAGIDLVAKFVYSDKKSEVSKRFKNYVSKYMSSEFAEEIFQLRNSLIHSFGLYSEAQNNKVYKFILVRGINDLIVRQDGITYYVDIEILRIKFDQSLTYYMNELSHSLELKSIFQQMYSKYGQMYLKKH